MGPLAGGMASSRGARCCNTQAVTKPARIRFMAEFGCAFPLWDDDGELEGDRETELPISPDLVSRLREWSEEWLRLDAGDASIDSEVWDERGFHLSEELQRELGDGYQVEYKFSVQGTRERLRPKVRVPRPAGKPRCRAAPRAD